MNQAKKEHDEVLYKWQCGEITTDELEDEYEKINDKYGTNYRLTGHKI